LLTACPSAVAMVGLGQDSIVLGSPSVLSTWVFELVREVCALIPERAATRVVDRNDLVESQSSDSAPSVVYLSQFPSSSLLAKCGEGAAPILLLLDEPVDAVRYFGNFRGAASLKRSDCKRPLRPAMRSFAATTRCCNSQACRAPNPGHH
jgi:hypothetical protein